MSGAVKGSIDAVITWVDGTDPVLHEKRAAYSGIDQIEESGAIRAGRHETRFLDNGELELCLRLLKKNAPWINRIYIVTDGQKPSVIEDDSFFRDKCILVDHSVIFSGYEHCLPTFNSRSIETLIWRIPGLSERFVYLNDDFFVVSKVVPEDFFIGANVVLRGRWRFWSGNFRLQLLCEHALTFLRWVFQKKVRTMHLLAQKKGAALAGYNWRYFRVPHTPHPMLKSKLAKYFEQNPIVIEENVRYQFRNVRQFWPVALSDHLNISSGNVTFDNAKSWAEFNGEVDGAEVILRMEKDIQSGKARFVTVAGLEKCPSSVRRLLESVIASRC